MRTVTKATSDYAARFGITVTIDRYGIYGDEWDWLAVPTKPLHYYVAPVRAPIETDPRAIVRILAERIRTGRNNDQGRFVPA
jgi:hypothetical protein